MKTAASLIFWVRVIFGGTLIAIVLGAVICVHVLMRLVAAPFAVLAGAASAVASAMRS